MQLISSNPALQFLNNIFRIRWYSGTYQLKTLLGYLLFASTIAYTSSPANAESVNIVIDSESNGFVIEGKFRTLRKQMSHSDSTLKSQNKTKSHTYRFVPDISEPGYYRVYAWWPTSKKFSSNAVFDIYHDFGTTTIEMNQQQLGGQWVLLGQFSIGSSSTGIIDISNHEGETIVADAIRYEYLGFEAPELSIDTTALELTDIGEDYEETIVAHGGHPPYKWKAISTLPPGLRLNSKTGIISGSPKQAGTYELKIQVSDSHKNIATTNFEIQVSDDVSKNKGNAF